MADRTSAHNATLVLMLSAFVITSVGCGKELILSKYGSKSGVSRTRSGFAIPRWRPHRGVDIKAYYVGDKVIASHGGTVAHVKFSKKAGWRITIHHEPSGMYTRYVHLQSPIVKQGDDVRRGQKIGEVGLFPYSAKVVHVHWMLCTNARCFGAGALGGTKDPLKRSIGCFAKKRQYPHRELALTLPVPCRNGRDGPELL